MLTALCIYTCTRGLSIQFWGMSHAHYLLPVDDIERTCRYWVADGGIVRCPAYHVQKRSPRFCAYGQLCDYCCYEHHEEVTVEVRLAHARTFSYVAHQRIGPGAACSVIC